MIAAWLFATGAACKPTAQVEEPDASSVAQAPQNGSSSVLPQSYAEILKDSDLPPTTSTPLPNDKMGVTVHRLSNGLTVYITTDRQKPRFSAWIGVRAGSRMDPANSTGLAHYLEHMLFKGTDEFGTLNAAKEAPHVERVRVLYGQLRQTDDVAKRAEILAEIDQQTQAMSEYSVPNELDRMYSKIGVDGLNAFTSDEQTVYVADVPANHFEAWARIEGERFSDPVFRLFLPELEAVYEEKNLSLDRPWSRVWETLANGLYPEHPYGTQTTIGSVEHLKNPAYQDMVDFFGRWYVPNNMAVVLAGDIDAKTAIPALEKAFGHLVPKPVPQPAPGKIKPLAGRVEREVLVDGEEGIQLAWLTVPTAHTDEPALAVMDRLLDDSKVGLLNVELELTQKVPEAGSFHSTMNESGYLLMQARAREGQSHAELEALLLGVATQLKNGEFTDEDVAAAKLQERIGDTYLRERPGSRASVIMDSFISHVPWSQAVARDEAFQEVTRADVVAVANKYLGSNYLVVDRRRGKVSPPKLEKPSITPVKIDPGRRSVFARSLEEMKATKLSPQWLREGTHYVHRTLPAGELIAAVNGRNDLFSLEYRSKRGYRKEPLLCYALELFELSGAGTTDAEALQKKLYALGSSVSTGCTAEESWIEIDGLDANLDATLALLDEWLASPAFDAETVKRLYDNTMSKRHDQFEQDWRLTTGLDLYAKYGKRSHWLQYPSNRQLARARPKKLAGLISGYLNYEHRTLYFGPRKADEIAAIVSRGRHHKPTGDVQKTVFRNLDKTQVFFLHKEGAKANVRFVIPAGRLPRHERPVARLLTEYLSGNMSALVFQEIREARGLAYSASSSYDRGERVTDETGLLGYLSTQADKTPVAIRTFLDLIQTDKIVPERLVAAQASLDQQFRATRIDPRWINAWVVEWDDLGEKTDPRPWEWDAVTKLGVADTEAFAKKFVGAPVIIAVVGDRERVNLAQLRKLGPVQELRPKDLFSYGPFPRRKDAKAQP